MLTLPRQLSGALRLTPAQVAELCEANPEAVLELEPDGRLVTMTPTGGTTGARNGTLVSLLWLAVREARLQRWCACSAVTNSAKPSNGALRRCVPIWWWNGSARATACPICDETLRPIRGQEAKTHFSRLIDAAHAGETILVTKGGKP